MGATDVFVIGGGPAGLAAAIAARKRGFSVIVADGAKPPIDKPCGEGLMPDALSALRGLGVSIGEGCGYPFRGIRFVGEGHQVSADFSVGLGLGVRRIVLHEKMIEHAERAGVKLWWNAPVTAISLRGVQVSGRHVSARYVIGADGMRSRVRRWFGLDRPAGGNVRFAFCEHYQVQPWTDHMELHWGRAGQAYVTPVSGQEVCVVLTSRQADSRRRTIGDEFPELAERLRGAEKGRQRGEITMTRSFPRVYSEHVALIGDASGTVDAITGEGLRLSFQQANALAEALVANDLRIYQRAHRRLAQGPAMMGRLLLLLDRYPWLRRQALRSLASHPSIFARMVALHTGVERPQVAQGEIDLAWGVRIASGVTGSGAGL